jgi:hypothetical protein
MNKQFIVRPYILKHNAAGLCNQLIFIINGILFCSKVLNVSSKSLTPSNFRNETSQQISSQDFISFRSSLSIAIPTLLPVNNSDSLKPGLVQSPLQVFQGGIFCGPGVANLLECISPVNGR